MVSMNIRDDETCRLVARERLDNRQHAKPFVSPEEVLAFFRRCDALDGPDIEPDWSKHLRVINGSRADKSAGT